MVVTPPSICYSTYRYSPHNHTAPLCNARCSGSSPWKAADCAQCVSNHQIALPMEIAAFFQQNPIYRVFEEGTRIAQARRQVIGRARYGLCHHLTEIPLSTQCARANPANGQCFNEVVVPFHAAQPVST